MAAPKIPSEEDRLRELDSFSILDSLPESDYDDLTTLAAEICKTPVSLVSLIDRDRQWFKSHHGIPVSETPRSQSFCAHAIIKPSDVFIIENTQDDLRFRDNPLVTGEPFISFYVGVPLVTKNGHALGTLCVIDNKPNKLSEAQIGSLKALANQVMKLLELRKSEFQLKQASQVLRERNQLLENFAEMAASDMKSPLSAINRTYEAFRKKYAYFISEEGLDVLHSINQAANSLRRMIDRLLANLKSERVIRLEKSTVNLRKMQQEIRSLFPDRDGVSVNFIFRIAEIEANKSALQQVFAHLISNAIRYCDKPLAEIEVGALERSDSYEFFVSDNGPGIEREHHKRIFEMFTVVQHVDRFGEFGTGTGLAHAKKLVEELGGEIEVESDMGVGSIFTFALPK